MPPRLQDIAPPDAALCLRAARFVREELGVDLHGRRLLAAVSGGADSTALLLILHLLRPKLALDLHALTLDHGLRPGSADEARAVRKLCGGLDIPCAARSIPAASRAGERGEGLEEAGRALRYAALEEERRRLDADWVVTGHQLDDLREDVFMRLLRGTGWPALGGMRGVDAERRVLRPLLLTPARELKDFLTRCNIAWSEDESNSDPRFLRNRLRGTILPLLEAESPRLSGHIAQLWRMARADEEHWNALLPRPAPDGAGDASGVDDAGGTNAEPFITLARDTLRGLDRAGRLRLFLKAVECLARTPESGADTPAGGQARAATLFALDAARQAGRGGTVFQFPGGVRAELRGGSVRFFRE